MTDSAWTDMDSEPIYGGQEALVTQRRNLEKGPGYLVRIVVRHAETGRTLRLAGGPIFVPYGA